MHHNLDNSALVLAATTSVAVLFLYYWLYHQAQLDTHIKFGTFVAQLSFINAGVVSCQAGFVSRLLRIVVGNFTYVFEEPAWAALMIEGVNWILYSQLSTTTLLIVMLVLSTRRQIGFTIGTSQSFSGLWLVALHLATIHYKDHLMISRWFQSSYDQTDLHMFAWCLTILLMYFVVGLLVLTMSSLFMLLMSFHSQNWRRPLCVCIIAVTLLMVALTLLVQLPVLYPGLGLYCELALKTAGLYPTYILP